MFFFYCLYLSLELDKKYGLDFTWGTTLRNATQAKRSNQGFIGQQERREAY